MRVFYTEEGLIINTGDDCPSIQWHIDNNSEEIPNSLFGNYIEYADSTNTHKVNDVWRFTPDTTMIDTEKVETHVIMEKEWVAEELQYADVQMCYHVDSSSRATFTPTSWSTYREELRDYIADGVVHGTRPSRPVA